MRVPRRFHLSASIVCLLLILPMFSASAATETRKEGAVTFNVSTANNLLLNHLGTPTYSGTSGQEGFATPAVANPVLIDGVFGPVNPDTTPATVAPLATGYVATFDLNLTTGPNGYFLNRVEVFGGWRDAGRDNQDFVVAYQPLAGGAFVDIATVSYAPTGGGPSNTFMTLTNLGIDATAIRAIRFTFPNQENGYSGYRELSAFGTRIPVTKTWTGGGGDNNWTTGANWGGTAPSAGDNLIFAGSTRLTPNNNFPAGTAFGSVTFAAGAGNFVLGGNAFSITGGTLTSNAAAGTMTINNAITFNTAAPTITAAAGGTLVLGGATTSNAGTISFAGAGDTVVSGAIGDASFAGALAATPSLNAHWRFNETTGTSAVDASPAARNGIYQGGPTLGQASFNAGLGTSVLFGANQYMSTYAADVLGFTSSFTAMAWVNASDVTGDKTIFGTPGSTNNQALHLIIRNARIHMGFFGNDHGGTVPLSANTWYHLVWRFDATVGNGTQAVFVNGALDSSSGNHANFAGTGVVDVGRWGGGNYFAGRIDEPAIYTRALSDAEIASVFSAGNPTAIQKTGSGTLALAGNNTYSGATSIQQGTVFARNNNALGSTATGTTVASGATLAIDGTSGNLTLPAEPLSVVAQPTATPVNALINVAGSNTYAGPITAASVLSDTYAIGFASNGGALNLSGAVNLGGADLVTGGVGNLALLGTVSGAGTASNYVSQVLSAGSVNAYWRFDETSGTTAFNAAGSQFNATYSGPTLGQPAQNPALGTAVRFNGSPQHVTTAPAQTLGLGGNFTAMAWVNASDVSGDKTIFGIDAGAANVALHLIIRNAKAHMGFFGNDTGGNATLTANTWYHIVWRYDSSVGGGTQSIFVNGVLDNSGGGHAAFAGTGTVNIGRWNTNNYFLGFIDEPAIIGRALTDPEILAIYNAGSTTSALVSTVTKNGGGTLTLAGANTYSGTTTVNGGVLLCSNTSGSATGTGVVTINTGATLSGTGSLSGGLTVSNGATVSPGNAGPGTLTVGPTVFNGTSTLASEIGTATDLLAVQGTLTVDGTVNVTLGTGGGAGVYTLVTYTGALTDNSLALGALPAGYTPTLVTGGGAVVLTLNANTTTTLAAVPISPTVYGQSVTFTAVIAPVAPAVGAPTGSVTFTVDGIAQPPVALVNGSASITLPLLSVGAHSIQVNYAGTPAFNASNNTLTHTVNQAQSSMLLVSNANPSVDGNVIFTATVAAVAPGGGVPMGTVVFSVNGVAQPAVTLTSGTAAIQLTLDSGSYTILAVYSGSTEHATSNATLTQAVRPSFTSPPTLTPNPAVTGQPITGVASVGSATIVWTWGDGTSTTGANVTHTYTVPGLYTATITATSGAESISQTFQVFVGMGLADTGGGQGGGATPPGATGILVGGSGAGKAQGGSGKIVCNYVRREKTTYSGSLGNLGLSTTLTQDQLINKSGVLTLGSGALAQSFTFSLSKNGRGRSTGLPQVEFSVKKKRFKFKAQRSELTDLTESLGGPRRFDVKKGQPVTLLVPATLQIGNDVFLAMTFQVKYQQISGGGKGALAP